MLSAASHARWRVASVSGPVSSSSDAHSGALPSVHSSSSAVPPSDSTIVWPISTTAQIGTQSMRWLGSSHLGRWAHRDPEVPRHSPEDFSDRLAPGPAQALTIASRSEGSWGDPASRSDLLRRRTGGGCIRQAEGLVLSSVLPSCRSAGLSLIRVSSSTVDMKQVAQFTPTCKDVLFAQQAMKWHLLVLLTVHYITACAECIQIWVARIREACSMGMMALLSMACTAGINRSNTAVRAVLEQPCSTGGRTGTVRPKRDPTGRTDLSDRSRLVLCDRSQELIGQACPTRRQVLRSDSACPTTDRARLFEHRSNCRVRPVNAGSDGMNSAVALN
ncbi:hypothetical protein PCANC_09316 [Puccinia coronata f. sp. avenae]|uniref:Uncharacterized protein n=1 Tax=Puccinia coronata f. sp. avenae TaxID=200324 RepID=A0A2N5T5K9_9BASI|nr:hypothetical protein PCANC_09316 [Puccinia coronata f. sp. avenae]